MRTLLLPALALAIMTSSAPAKPAMLTTVQSDHIAVGQSQTNAVNVRCSPVVVDLDRAFVLALGQKADLAADHLTIVFSRVVEDSRCPTDVACVWPGNAKIELRLAGPSLKPALVYLNTTLTPSAAAYGDYQLSLLSLQPYPSSKFGRPKTYSATLLAKRR